MIRYLAFPLVLLAASVQAGDLQGRVVGVADGDTLTVLVAGNEPHRIRLAEIDAPEKAQPFGQRSKQSLSALCFARQARVQVQDHDRYGRIVGRVICDGVDANAAQVERGMAWVYDRYAHDPRLYRLQSAAQAAKRGLWADPKPIPPWEWRRHKKQRGE